MSIKEALDSLREAYAEAKKERDETMKDLLDKCDYETKLAVTAWVFDNIVKHGQEGGSYRYLIYDRLGFGLDAYAPLYEAGGMTISNDFDLDLKDRLIKHLKKNDIGSIKRELGLCDVVDCFGHVSAGTPTEDGYRYTCSDHDPLKKS